MPPKKGMRRGPYRKRKAVARRGRVAKYGRKTGGFAKKVWSVVKSHAEIKECFGASSISPATISASSTSVAGNMFVCSPNNASSTIGYLNIPTGTGNGQRVGNRITTKSLVMKYIMSQSAQNATTNPIPTPLEVMIYFFKVKVRPQETPAIGNLRGVNADFFEYGNQSIGFDGSLYDVLHKINPDKYTYLCHRRHKLGYSSNNQQANTLYVNSHNNDFKMNIVGSVNLTKYCPKEIIYDDSAGSTTSSPYIFCLVQPLNATGFVNPITTLPVNMLFELQYRYVDI